MNEQLEREQFEKWFAYLARPVSETLWMGWKARAELAAQEPSAPDAEFVGFGPTLYPLNWEQVEPVKPSRPDSAGKIIDRMKDQMAADLLNPPDPNGMFQSLASAGVEPYASMDAAAKEKQKQAVAEYMASTLSSEQVRDAIRYGGKPILPIIEGDE